MASERACTIYLLVFVVTVCVCEAYTAHAKIFLGNSMKISYKHLRKKHFFFDIFFFLH